MYAFTSSFFSRYGTIQNLHSFPTRRSSDLAELGASQRLLEHCEYEGDRSMHLREPLLGVVLHAEKARLVVEVVLEHEVQVRIEERPVIGHEVEGRLIEQYAVLDRRRPGQHGAPSGLRRMSMG